MIQIRSITYQMPKEFDDKIFVKIRKNSQLWNLSDFFIRTKRVSLVPISKAESLKKYKTINTLCNKCDIRWFNVPLNPWKSKNKTELFKFGYDILKNFDQSFVNVDCIKNGKFDFDTINKSVKLIKQVSNISKNGKDNFRLGISTNISHGCPFFPFSMSSGEFSFSIALELTQEINKIIKENSKLNLLDLRKKIVDVIYPQINEIYKTSIDISNQTGIPFCGFDFSLAPIIDENGSIITIIRHLGVENFGKTGTMFATSYLTNILKYFAKEFPSVGFAGVMYSLLEDLELCKINNSKGVSLEDLIKLSTMCGCGIDMVPVPQDTTNEQLRTAIIEIGAISTRLNKPLGIRFLPIPNIKSGKEGYTNFNEDADFISNTKVLSLSNNCILDNQIDYFEFLNLNKDC